MEIAAGNWAVKYNDEVLSGVESAEPALDQETVDITTLDGVKITKVKSRSAEVVLTFVDTGIDNAKKFLPDNWLAQGTQIDGQPVGTLAKAGVSEKGVIVYGKPNCGTAQLTAPLQLVPCENPDEHTITLFDGVAEMTNVSLDDGVLKIEVTVRSQSVGVQLAKGAIDFPAES
ncbi:MAG: hypothetical protein WC426_13605 [Sulfuriferula sp.]